MKLFQSGVITKTLHPKHNYVIKTYSKHIALT